MVQRAQLTAAAILLSATLCAPAAAASMPDGAAILPGRLAGELLGQCSRATPEMGGATWRPEARDIAELEAALPAALAHEPQAGSPGFARAPKGWLRQYVGITRRGRRLIYGNFVPKEGYFLAGDRWRASAIVVCDGGPSFFGVEYDLAAHRFTQIAFNGIA